MMKYWLSYYYYTTFLAGSLNKRIVGWRRVTEEVSVHMTSCNCLLSLLIMILHRCIFMSLHLLVHVLELEI